MTYKAAQGMSTQVRKGAKGELVVYADEMTKKIEDKDSGELKDTPIWFWKGYTVFNVSQIDGLPAAFYEKPVTKLMDKPERILSAQQFVVNTGAKIIEEGSRAYYRPSDDTIRIPEIERFKSVESYHAVTLHELAHWTGHETRLKREFGKGMRTDDYGREELVAEISSAFLCATLEITHEVRQDHAGYLASWLGILKTDKRAIFAAAAQAQKAADYLHGLQPTTWGHLSGCSLR
jgi:antirestriction protein ArdC